MSVISEENSNKIANMAFVCACLVVWQHQGGPAVAIPFFFTVSGYMLARHVDQKGWWIPEVLKRVKSLLVPFVFWAVVTQLIMLPLSVYADRLAGRPFGASVGLLNGNLLSTFGLDLTQWPYLIPLWYLRCLFLLVLFAPLWVVCVRKAGWYWCALCLLANCCIELIPGFNECVAYGVLTKCFNLGGLAWFSVGMCLCLRGKLEIAHPYLVALVSAATGCLLFVIFERPFFAGHFVLLALWLIMPKARFPKAISSSPMAIYLGHMSFIFIVGAMFRHIACSIAVKQAVTVLIAIVGCIAMNACLRKAPKLAAVAFGGR